LFGRRQDADEHGNVLPTHTHHTTPPTADTTDPRRSSATYPVDYEPGATRAYPSHDNYSPERDGIGHPVGRTTGAAPTDAGMYDNTVREKPARQKGGAIRSFFHHLTVRDGDPYGRRPTFKEWWRMYWHDL